MTVSYPETTRVIARQTPSTPFASSQPSLHRKATQSTVTKRFKPVLTRRAWDRNVTPPPSFSSIYKALRFLFSNRKQFQDSWPENSVVVNEKVSGKRDSFSRKMKHYFALSHAVRRALISGRNCNGHGSAVVRPFVAAETRHLCSGGGNGGFFYWKRMMASQPAPAGKAEAKSSPGKEKEESSRTEAGKGSVLPSYWGISRPKITREDGTEWPWNCFMVRIDFDYIEGLCDVNFFALISFSQIHYHREFLYAEFDVVYERRSFVDCSVMLMSLGIFFNLL